MGRRQLAVLRRAAHDDPLPLHQPLSVRDVRRPGDAAEVRQDDDGADRIRDGPANASRGKGACRAKTMTVSPPPGATPLIAIRDLVKRYGDKTILDGIDLTIERGETLVI